MRDEVEAGLPGQRRPHPPRHPGPRPARRPARASSPRWASPGSAWTRAAPPRTPTSTATAATAAPAARPPSPGSTRPVAASGPVARASPLQCPRVDPHDVRVYEFGTRESWRSRCVERRPRALIRGPLAVADGCVDSPLEATAGHRVGAWGRSRGPGRGGRSWRSGWRPCGERIGAACAAAGRDPDQVELMAVTKTVPAADVAALIDLGLTLFGENRAQEAGAKVAEVAALRPDAAGRAGTSSAACSATRPGRSSAGRPGWSRSTPSASPTPSTAAARACDDGRRTGPLPVLLQYSVDGDPARGGVPSDGLLAARRPRRRLPRAAPRRADGGRAAATPTPTPPSPRSTAAPPRLRSAHPAATVLSAGMSGDLEIAIRHASGVVRVGTALVGYRPLASS